MMSLQDLKRRRQSDLRQGVEAYSDMLCLENTQHLESCAVVLPQRFAIPFEDPLEKHALYSTQHPATQKLRGNARC